MRRAVLLAVFSLSLTGALAACTSQPPVTPSPTSGPTNAQPAVAVPPAPVAGPQANCPYLDKTFVADANGQHVGSVRISAPIAGQPHPSCFFYRPVGGVQVTVRVYAGDPAVAQAIVNQATPPNSADPASEPAGWQGGAQSNGKNAVYAVAKGGDAVVVTTNQPQTIKARQIAIEAISKLKFS